MPSHPLNKPHILFVCGRNRWRSPTAERIYRNDGRIDVRSAGVSDKSPHPISMADIAWADLILVMERSHASRIRTTFRGLVLPPIESLDVPDEYEYMDAELIELLQASIEPHIKRIIEE